MEKLKVEYFTDPLCCWSWAFEPQFRKLRFLLRDNLDIKYVMGGLIRNWNSFNDQMNDISRPAQMGPLWMQARNISGQPIDENIWVKNPIDTSYPSCMAVKAAALQGKVEEEAMLRSLREAVMMHQKDIGDVDTILRIAENLESEGILNKDDFRNDFFSDSVSSIFKKDLDRSKAAGISRFPTLLIQYEETTVQITGYRPFRELQKTFKLLNPDLDLEQVIEEDVYLKSWKFLTERELMEGMNSSAVSTAG